MSVYLSIHPSIYLSICLPACLSVCLSNCKLENAAILRDFLNFWTWQHPKQSYSARLPQFLNLTWQRQKRNKSARLPQALNLTTSKTKQFCETSWIFEVDKHQKRKQFCETSSLRKSAPGPSNSSDEHVSCTAPAAENASLQILFKCPNACHHFWKCHKTLTFCSLLARCTIPCACHAKGHLNVQKWSEHVSAFNILTRNVLRATTACTFSTSQLPKTVWTWCVLCILTSNCASRHNSVHFFDISASKSAPRPNCFVRFDLEMCFAPQRLALFRHLNFQKCSKREVFLAFSLANLLRATTACNFSSLIWPAGSAPAALASLLFDPPEPQIIGKTQCFTTSLPLRAPGASFFWDFLFFWSSFFFSSLLWLFPSLHLSILSEVWLLNFLRSKQVRAGSGSKSSSTSHI